MATYATLGNFYNASSGNLLERFVGGLMVEIATILAEDSGTTNHEARLTWANSAKVKSKADFLAEAEKHMRITLATNASIQASLNDATDGDILYCINVQVDAGY